MYAGAMKTVTITMPEDLDERAMAEAQRLGISKSELIRKGLDAVLPPIAEPEAGAADPWRSLAGFGSPTVSAGPGSIDDVIYGT